MIRQLIACSSFFLIAFVGCQKVAVTKENSVNDAVTGKTTQDELSLNSMVSSAHWYGSYVNAIYNSEDPDLPNGFPDSISDADCIANGVAKLPTIDRTYTFDYSNISLDIPSQYNVPGDSLIFQTNTENPATGSTFNYDVVLQITGDQHSAELHFVANAAEQQNDQYYIGNTRYYNLPQLVHYFGNFTTIKWVMKKNQTTAYINGKLAYKFSYGAANRIGKVHTITVAGKNYVVVNSVSLLNSFTNKKILTENFNTDGQSHTVFY